MKNLYENVWKAFIKIKSFCIYFQKIKNNNVCILKPKTKKLYFVEVCFSCFTFYFSGVCHDYGHVQPPGGIYLFNPVLA